MIPDHSYIALTNTSGSEMMLKEMIESFNYIELSTQASGTQLSDAQVYKLTVERFELLLLLKISSMGSPQGYFKRTNFVQFNL